MGRSLLVAVYAAPADWKTRNFDRKIDELPSAALSELFDGGLLNSEDILDEAPEDADLLDEEGGVDEGHPKVVAYVEEMARQRLKVALSELRDEVGSRDLYQFELEPGWVLLGTGGQSWGDAPTDAYGPLMMLGVAGVFDKVKYARVTRRAEQDYAREAEISALVVEIGDADVADTLNDLVYDNCSRDASNINNEGVESQIDYLVKECGMSVSDVRRVLMRDGHLSKGD